MKVLSLIKLFTLFLINIINIHDINQYFSIISKSSFITLKSSLRGNNESKDNHDGITACGNKTPNCVGGYYITDNQSDTNNESKVSHDGITPCGNKTPNCVGGYYINE